MDSPLELRPTRCAICDVEDNSTELYAANFELAAFSPGVFSARRLPDQIHYRLVRCNTCGLVRSDPIANRALLERLYAQASFDYGQEVENLKATYRRYLDRLQDYGDVGGALLEIGCGNGFFLEEALKCGYTIVQGVEPGKGIVEQAKENIRPNIVCDVMHPGLFPPMTFDAICLFQVFDHIADPNELLSECYKILKPNGLMLFINHNISSFSARLLKEKSPIVDIEHTYLYSPTTMQKIVLKHNFEVNAIMPVANRYSLHYYARLVPLPPAVKKVLLQLLDSTSVGKLPLSVSLGNLCLIAQKGQSKNGA